MIIHVLNLKAMGDLIILKYGKPFNKCDKIIK